MYFCRKKDALMDIFRKIKQKAEHYYRHHIVCEQYPMLTSYSRRTLRAYGTIGIVYMLHHISKKNPEGIPTNEDLKISPQFLEEIILRYKKQGFDFISLNKLSEIISSKETPEHPFIVITIDDGYLDNYTEAFPVFERQQVPFAIFVATDFIDKRVILWWDILEDLILKNNSVKMGENEYQCQTFQEKWDVFRILREKILQFDQKNLEHELREAFNNYDIDWYEPVRRKAMSWELIKTISKHPLCTIGAHTVSHPALNQLSDKEFRKEIADGVAKLEEAIGKPIQHFAYPYGSPNEIGEREYNLISEFNFKTVFTSYGGCITESNKKQITHLPRVFLKE